MKNTITCAMTVLLAMACFQQARSQPVVKPDSPEWAEIYDPPYKVPTELPADSALRRELFAILRSKVTPGTRFSGNLRVFRNWALFIGRTVDQKGQSIKHGPMGNDDALGLWLRTSEGWNLVDSSFGHSDAYFVIFPQRYGVPSELIGLRAGAETEEQADGMSPATTPPQDK